MKKPQHKLMNKLNQHPKLKKTLKLFAVVCVVLSFLFNALILVTVIINSSYKDDSYSLQKSSKPVARLFDGETKALIMSNDTLSSEFLNNTLYYGSDFILNYDINNSYTSKKIDLNNISSQHLNGNIITAINNVDYNNGYVPNGTLNTDYFTCDSLVIDLLGKYTFGGLPMYNLQFTFVSYYNSSYHDIVSFKIDCFKLSNQQMYSFSNYQVVSYVNTVTSDFVIITNKLDSDLNLLYTFITVDENKSYQYGFDNGYYKGYREGYYDASNGTVGNGMSTNPFSLITNAFDSIASILNIEILPNLNIGVLIFVPLIVTIIIALFRMWKG